MSNLSGLPPSSVIRAASLAVSQDLAVRLVRLPDAISDNPQPLRLTGIVKGASPEGAVRVETERGVIEILLKDRGSLPAGQKLEIDIPAGRPPASAAIRATAEPSVKIPPLATYIDPGKTPPVRLDRGPNLKSGDVAQALSAAGDAEEIRPGGQLQPGQILRLIPISSLPQTLGTIQNTVLFTPEELFAKLVNFIDQAIDLPVETKKILVQAMARMDIPALLQSPSKETPVTRQQQLQTLWHNLSQVIDLPESIELRNTSYPKGDAYLFNPAKPLDVQVLAFQKTSFQTTLQQVVQTAISTPPATVSSAPITEENFMVLASPAGKIPAAFFGSPQAAAPASISLPAAPDPVRAPVTVPSSPSPPASVSAQSAPVPTGGTPLSPSSATPPPLPPTPSLPPTPVLLGQVTGMTQGGLPVVALALPDVTEPQLYVAQFRTNNITPGAPLLVSPLPVTVPAKTGAGFVPFGIGGNQNLAQWTQADLWEPLQSLLAGAGQIDPSFLHAATRMLPTPSLPQNMAPLSLFILSVMRTGDLDSWIGEPVLEALKNAGKLDLVRAAAGETAMFQRLENAPLPNEWKATMLPFWHNGQVNKLPLYFKQWNDDASGAENERGNKLRFMFELKLSRMGAVQVDGFMQQKKLDMILRTKAAISVPMQEALRKTYHKAMENSNLSGEMTFQFKPEQWVTINLQDKSLA